jgi:hypothetical protein
MTEYQREGKARSEKEKRTIRPTCLNIQNTWKKKCWDCGPKEVKD